MKKRSVSIRGHATSISLEDPFWTALRNLAKQKEISIAELITRIDANRSTGLSSAIRVYILEQVQNGQISKQNP